MLKRIILLILLGAFVMTGCGYKYRDSVEEYRSEKLRLQYPKWDEETTQKVVARKIETGMTPEMVAGALGTPDSISKEGDEEKWGYAILVDEDDAPAMKKFVYFVYFKNNMVIRTAGDRNRLPRHHWYK
jgi:outer membrane protein assembly factor BamE (lipoprotein component of BamABCDE complex)